MRHTALPRAGRRGQLLQAGRAHLLPAPGPLEAAVGDVARRGARRAAASRSISKTHHAVVDGVSGVDLATVLFDLVPEGRGRRRAASRGWRSPSRRRRARRRAVTGAVRAGPSVATRRARRGLARRARRSAGRASVARPRRGRLDRAQPPPGTPLNVRDRPAPPRRGRAASLDDFKRVKDAFGGTVNDVVLAVVAGALRFCLRSRGRRTEGVELRVPSRSRCARTRSAARSATSWRSSSRRCRSTLDDPLARLRLVRRRWTG